jgi:hypothetical protein
MIRRLHHSVYVLRNGQFEDEFQNADGGDEI